MSSQKVVVMVEEVAAARTSVEWAVRNFTRPADSLVLLHVYPHTKSRAKRRRLRLRGFQLALSFRDLCNGIGETKLEIIVMEGDQGSVVVTLVNKIGASTLIIGLHDQSFIFKAIPSLGELTLNCRILAIKHHSSTHYGLQNTEFSQVEISKLRKATVAKTWLLIFLCPLGRILKQSKRS